MKMNIGDIIHGFEQNAFLTYDQLSQRLKLARTRSASMDFAGEMFTLLGIKPKLRRIDGKVARYYARCDFEETLATGKPLARDYYSRQALNRHFVTCGWPRQRTQ